MSIEETDGIYLLHAVWKDEHGDYRHRVICSQAKGPMEMIERWIQAEHPKWLPENTGKIGYVDNMYRCHGATVFKVESEDRDKAFQVWLKTALEKRAVIDERRERDRDLATIEELKKKWGLD